MKRPMNRQLAQQGKQLGAERRPKIMLIDQLGRYFLLGEPLDPDSVISKDLILRDIPEAIKLAKRLARDLKRLPKDLNGLLLEEQIDHVCDLLDFRMDLYCVFRVISRYWQNTKDSSILVLLEQLAKAIESADSQLRRPQIRELIRKYVSQVYLLSNWRKALKKRIGMRFFPEFVQLDQEDEEENYEEFLEDC